MPIYGDYHGDFQNSTNSSWDQIQANLKILLPSYQPIPSYSRDELSFLSFQKQQRICSEIKEICNNMCATLNEMIQEEEQADADNSRSTNTYKSDSRIQYSTTNSSDHKTDPDADPNIQAQIQHNSAPEINVQIQPDQESENEKSEYEINEETTIQQTDPELTTSIKPQLISAKQNRSQDQKQEDEDELDVRSIYHGGFDRSAMVVVDRPLPEPPDLHSLEVGDGEPESTVVTATAGLCRTKNLRHTVTETHCGAEVGGVAKGKLSMLSMTTTATDLRCGSDVGYVDDGLRARLLRRFVLLTPPPLLAAVIPWNRDGEREEWSRGCWQWSPSMVERRSNAGASWKGGKGAVDGETRGGQCAWWVTIMGERVMAIGGAEQRKEGQKRERLQNDEGKELTPILGLGFNWSYST
ncbi:hypothetical protein PIB30_019103 [Stylosanthes scabra]|uniref:Uncharacterized protein n=1 Tax=Stylosanthes scabra TaxID=79078 RepID=A0ABU6V7X8_9FABA|nr:hypothetical protein [Stylosanthes scabra]